MLCDVSLYFYITLFLIIKKAFRMRKSNKPGNLRLILDLYNYHIKTSNEKHFIGCPVCLLGM